MVCETGEWRAALVAGLWQPHACRSRCRRNSGATTKRMAAHRARTVADPDSLARAILYDQHLLWGGALCQLVGFIPTFAGDLHLPQLHYHCLDDNGLSTALRS